jgi:hypothetical protein
LTVHLATRIMHICRQSTTTKASIRYATSAFCLYHKNALHYSQDALQYRLPGLIIHHSYHCRPDKYLSYKFSYESRRIPVPAQNAPLTPHPIPKGKFTQHFPIHITLTNIRPGNPRSHTLPHPRRPQRCHPPQPRICRSNRRGQAYPSDNRLTYDLIIRTGNLDSDPVGFMYGDFHFMSDDPTKYYYGELDCHLGGYDGGKRQMDCELRL